MSTAPMMPNKQCFLRIAITKDQDTGLWVSHCLNIDLVSQGHTAKDAAEAIREAILMVFDDDLAHNLDPLDRAAAPDECWAPFHYAIQEGQPVQSLDHSPNDPGEDDWVFACTMLVIRPHHSVVDGEPGFQLPVPEAWQIAGLEKLRHSSVHC